MTRAIDAYLFLALGVGVAAATGFPIIGVGLAAIALLRQAAA